VTTVFLSAFLLFAVQLAVGKAILPWFGGTAAVWMTCLLFFQALLFGGYLYASLLVEKVSARRQGLVHLALLLATLCLLPIAPSAGWKPVDGSNPTLRILGLLATAVGGPFFVLSATGPLLQAWSARLRPGRSPYRLYALSNAGSLIGLVAYPILVEPALPLRAQMTAWSIAYAGFVLLCGGWALRRSVSEGAAAPAAAGDARPDGVALAFWIGLSACGSAMLLATTNEITQDVAPVPFLWVVPLALYLLSFVLCFGSARAYRRGLVGWSLAASLFLVAGVHFGRMDVGLWPQVAGTCAAQLACCTACHGELARLKPEPRRLTTFYLCVSAGGALGAVLVTLVAPLVFRTLADFPVALAACCLAWSVARRFESVRRRLSERPRRTTLAVAGLALAGAVPASSFAWSGYLSLRGVLEASRNFYGVLQVSDEQAGDPPHRFRKLSHGTTVHGVQSLDPAERATAASYYGPQSGIAACLSAARRLRPGPLRIGVVGMGAGSIAAYAGPEDEVVFYEINPEVVRLARKWFTYWDDAVARGARLEVRLGDARLVLERELADGGTDPFDVLAVDAFTGDAIPVHLLTTECFDLYRRRLDPRGLLAVHVSNVFLELAPVVRDQAERLGWSAVLLSSKPDAARGWFAADWVATSPERAWIDEIGQVPELAAPWPEVRLERPWTDDFSSLWPLLK
jgi:hypothetical protein